MSYWWRPGAGSHDLPTLEANGLLPRFEDQQPAEEWLGLFFSDLRAQGVIEVSLVEEDRLVYGPMLLED